MAALQFSITINAPKEKVWHSMLDKKTYPQWTEAFSPGSTYEGSWEEGSEIRFVGPGENGPMGIVSRIKVNKPYHFISIEHLGQVLNGKVDMESEEAKEWAGALENYSFTEANGSTHVVVDMGGNIKEEYRQMFETMWPKALQRLKEIAEKETD
ncbi:MAG: SRPBCC family protein [Flavisolibacter sp.]